MPFWNPARWERPFPELYQNLLDQIVRVEELGYDNIWLTEHHFDADGWSPALLPLAAGIATRTTRIRIGTFILILPFQHALRVAEDAITVDILSNGHFDLGVGKGYRTKEFTAFGFPREQRDARLEEDLAVLQGLWTNEAFSFEGNYYHLKAPSSSHTRRFGSVPVARKRSSAPRLGYHLMVMGTGEVSHRQEHCFFCLKVDSRLLREYADDRVCVKL